MRLSECREDHHKVDEIPPCEGIGKMREAGRGLRGCGRRKERPVGGLMLHRLSVHESRRQKATHCCRAGQQQGEQRPIDADRKSTRLNSSHHSISYAVFCLKKKKKLRTEYDIKREQNATVIYIIKQENE